MNIRNTRSMAAALLLVLTAACSACTSTRTAAPTALPTGQSPAATAATQAVGSRETASATAPTPTPSEPSLKEWASSAATGVVDANKDSTTQTDVDAWIEQMKAYSVEDYSAASRKNTSAGAAWNDAHAKGASLAAKVTIDKCTRPPGWGDESMVLACTTTTTVTDTSGNSLSETSLPPSWKNRRTTMQYEMTQDGGTWKVKTASVASAG